MISQTLCEYEETQWFERSIKQSVKVYYKAQTRFLIFLFKMNNINPTQINSVHIANSVGAPNKVPILVTDEYNH